LGILSRNWSFTFLLLVVALYPARHAQWKVDPVLIQEVLESQLFEPEIGLQVPHTSLFSGMRDDETMEVVRSRREAKFKSIFIFAESLVVFVYVEENQEIAMIVFFGMDCNDRERAFKGFYKLLQTMFSHRLHMWTVQPPATHL